MGSAAPICARTVKMVAGMTVTADVLMTRKRIISSLAVCLSGFSSCSSSMALRPRGVAALSSPSMLAAMFMTMLPVAGCPAGMPGKSRRSRGPNNRATRSTAPPRSPMRMMPNHRQMTPVRPSAILKAVSAMSKVEPTISAHTSVWPAKERTTAATKPPRKKKVQILLSIRSPLGRIVVCVIQRYRGVGPLSSEKICHRIMLGCATAGGKRENMKTKA